MIEVNKEEIVKKVKEIASEKKNWHFHFLKPKCIFNDKDKFAIVLEDEDKTENYICHFDEQPKELKIFENLFYNRPEDFEKCQQ